MLSKERVLAGYFDAPATRLAPLGSAGSPTLKTELPLVTLVFSAVDGLKAMRVPHCSVLCWAGLGWAGLGWAGLGCAGLGWVGLCCAMLCCADMMPSIPMLLQPMLQDHALSAARPAYIA